MMIFHFPQNAFTDPPENTTISHDVLHRHHHDGDSQPLSSTLPTIDVEEGQSPPRVSCSGNAYPPLQYQWLRNDQVKSDGPILHIYEPLKREDDGIYECISKNKHGNQTAQMRINILCKCANYRPGPRVRNPFSVYI